MEIERAMANLYPIFQWSWFGDASVVTGGSRVLILWFRVKAFLLRGSDATVLIEEVGKWGAKTKALEEILFSLDKHN